MRSLIFELLVKRPFVAFSCVVATATIVSGATPRELRKLDSDLGEVGRHFKAGNYEVAAGSLTEIIETIHRWHEQDPEIASQLEARLQTIRRARGALEFQRQFVGPVSFYKPRNVDETLSAEFIDSEMSGMTPPNLKDAALPSADSMMSAPGSTSGSVTFASDVAPILSTRCGNCHINNSRGGFSMQTFTALMDSGFVEPGDSGVSLLVEVIESGDMPPGNNNSVPPSELAKLKQWIDSGANPGSARVTEVLTSLSTTAFEENSTPEEISAYRASLVRKNLQVALGNAAIRDHEGNSALVIGTLESSQLQEISDAVDRMALEIGKDLGISARRQTPFGKGRITVVALSSSYDYSEFRRMASIPSSGDLPVVWNRTGRDALIALKWNTGSPASLEEDQLRQWLTAPLASLAMATIGPDTPRWFAEGYGLSRWLNDRRIPESFRMELTRVAEETAGDAQNAARFLRGQLAAEQHQAAAARTVAIMKTTDSGRWRSLIQKLGKSEGFEASIQSVYGQDLQNLVKSIFSS
ncbi:MAG: hypothetical protein AAF664_05390 [Planctomycetota bacterium]